MVSSLIWPSCEKPPSVNLLATTRLGGVSPSPWNSFNLGINTQDTQERVLANRSLLAQSMRGVEVQWLKQVHGAKGVVLQNSLASLLPEADFSYTRERGIACAILTADCLPILIWNRSGTEIAAIHAGWRGLAAGVIASALSHFQSPVSELAAWIGPAIGQKAFEVGEDVLDAMAVANLEGLQDLTRYCTAHSAVQGKFYMDLVGIARVNLNGIGVDKVDGGIYCSYSDSERFFSYRRDGETGRMASLIWMEG